MKKSIKEDFRNFYKSRVPYGMTEFDARMKSVQGYVNPYILEERELNMSQLDIFSRLMVDRQLFYVSEFTDESCSIMIAQLLYLDSVSDEDITINIMSPGGSCSAGLGIIDTIGRIKCDIRTVNVASAYSMGLVLLVSGKKGKRVALPHSEGLLHMPSGGVQGTSDDIQITADNIKRTKQILFEFIGSRTGHTWKEIEEMCPRDRWMSAEEMLKLGFVDEIEKIDWSKK